MKSIKPSNDKHIIEIACIFVGELIKNVVCTYIGNCVAVALIAALVEVVFRIIEEQCEEYYKKAKSTNSRNFNLHTIKDRMSQVLHKVFARNNGNSRLIHFRRHSFFLKSNGVCLNLQVIKIRSISSRIGLL